MTKDFYPDPDFPDAYLDSNQDDFPEADNDSNYLDEDHGEYSPDDNQSGFAVNTKAMKEPPTAKTIRISNDKGQTWFSQTVDMKFGFEDVKLTPGQLVIIDYEQYDVVMSDFGDVQLQKSKKTKKATKIK